MSAAFVDVNRDGWLDLFLVNYTDFTLEAHKRCTSSGGAPDYCGPRSYRPEPDRLLLNRTDNGVVRFVDVSEESGVAAVPGPGLGVVVADIDSDGWPDIYVANDQDQNHLWMSRGLTAEGVPRLVEDALLRGVAVDSLGRSQASMGVDAGDVDGDGDTDLFMTHLRMETNTLYTNDGKGLFTEQTTRSGLAQASIPMTGFGTAMLDVDNDGWLDILAANGEVRLIEAQRAAGVALPLEQANQLFRNNSGTFSDWTAAAPVLTNKAVSRGVAVGDVDNDGDPDALITNNNAALELLINQVGSKAPWVGLRLLDERGRAAIGATVKLYRDQQPVLMRSVRRASSYLSSHDPRVLFGLGRHSEIDRIEILWPNGKTDVLGGLQLNRYHEVTQNEVKATS